MGSELGDLQHHYGEAYVIADMGRYWLAQRRDDRVMIRAETAGELLEKIRADYARKPVPRPE